MDSGFGFRTLDYLILQNFSFLVPQEVGVVGAILIGFWYIRFLRHPPIICELFNLCLFMQTDF